MQHETLHPVSKMEKTLLTSTLRALKIPLSCTLGVPATSRILTGDSQKLNFSTLTKVPFLIF